MWGCRAQEGLPTEPDYPGKRKYGERKREEWEVLRPVLDVLSLNGLWDIMVVMLSNQMDISQTKIQNNTK